MGRQLLKGMLCACGHPAVRIHGNLGVCARCWNLEHRQERTRRYRTYNPNAKYAIWMFCPDYGHNKQTMEL